MSLSRLIFFVITVCLGSSLAYEGKPYQTVRTAYCVMSGSGVRMVSSC